MRSGGAATSLPPSAGSSPARMRRSVLLPTPLGPTTPIRLRGPMVRSTPSSTTNVPWDRVMPVATRVARGREGDMKGPRCHVLAPEAAELGSRIKGKLTYLPVTERP